MDSFRSVLRVGLWWCFLLCVLPVTANAATRQMVPIPSDSKALNVGAASKASGLLKVGVLEGEFIAGQTLNRKTPIKVLKTIDYSIPRTITRLKSFLKVSPAQAIGSVFILGAVEAVGWVMSPDNTLAKKKIDYQYPAAPNFYYTFSGYPNNKFNSIRDAYDFGVSNFNPTGYKDIKLVYSPSGVFQGNPVAHLSAINSTYGNEFILPIISFGSCSSSPTVNGCPSSQTETLIPVQSSDFSQLDPFVSSQTAPWLAGLIKDVCLGSLAPSRCFDELKDSRMVSGPSSVTGPSTTTNGTYTRPDGTTGTTSSTTNTNYDISYGPTYFDYTENKTVTNYKDGTKTDESTTSDTPEITDEKPEEEKDETSPCTQNCDGPAYVDMYQPSTDTKEQELDSYSSRFKSVPIFAAASNMFTLNVSGGACPVWQYHGSLSLLSVSADMPIDLVFDYHCLPWFVDLGPFIKAIILIGFTYIAFRIGVL